MSNIKEVHSKPRLWLRSFGVIRIRIRITPKERSLCVPVNLFWSMAAMLRDSVAAVVHTRLRAIPLAMITMRKSTHGFPFLSRNEYGTPLGGPPGRLSSAKTLQTFKGPSKRGHIVADTNVSPFARMGNIC